MLTSKSFYQTLATNTLQQDTDYRSLCTLRFPHLILLVYAQHFETWLHHRAFPLISAPCKRYFVLLSQCCYLLSYFKALSAVLEQTEQ